MTVEAVDIAVIGGGPAGLAAAETLVEAGRAPVIFEAKPSPARKFLMAGKSGLNITKDESPETFAAAINTPSLTPLLETFGPDAIRAWAEGLGEPLFTGSSGRVFPLAMKASPLLRKWLARLEDGGASLRTRWRWTGWDGDVLLFETPDGARRVTAGATVIAAGGASWSRLGSDGAWAEALAATGAPVAPFRPANMGFERPWSDHFSDRFAGAPVKPAALSFKARTLRGEFAISRYGVEGSAIYALSADLRDAMDEGPQTITLDLVPDVTATSLAKKLSRPRGKLSRSNFLRKTIGLTGVRAGLLRELAPETADTPDAIAAAIKALPLRLDRPRPIDEAISTAGGLMWEGLDGALMLRARPGVFAAGEMMDWEAPTGGYLLTACIATGRHAGAGAARWAKKQAESASAP